MRVFVCTCMIAEHSKYWNIQFDLILMKSIFISCLLLKMISRSATTLEKYFFVATNKNIQHIITFVVNMIKILIILNK